MVAIVERDGKRWGDYGGEGELEIKYGLPGEVKFCARCVISNQRPNSEVEFAHTKATKKQTIHFDEDSICDACRYAKFKEADVDWQERRRALETLCDQYRSHNGSYDCLVPGSGGKDSVYASHVLKAEFGMTPLTVTWAPHLYTDVGWRNFQNWLHIGGFDNFLFTPDGVTHRKLTQIAFRNLLHPFQPFILGQKNFAPRIAVRMGIPLVFYGENEAEYGNPISANESAQRATSYFSMRDRDNRDLYFGGIPMSELSAFDIPPGKMDCYLPEDAEILEQAEIAVHYLGYYMRWTPQENYYYAVEHTAFEANTERTEGTYSKYSGIDDKTDPYHYWTTLVKFGLGRTSYDAAQEIRNKHLTREEGVALVNRFDQEFPRRFFTEFLKYLDMDEGEFFEIVDSFRSPHLWQKTGDGWELRNKIT